MANDSGFPIRQKLSISFTVVAGLFILVCSVFHLLHENTLNTLICIYAIGIPSFLLMFDTIIDLNDKRIFIIWVAIAAIIFIVSLTTLGNARFILQRNSNFESVSKVNSWIINYSTSALKAPLIFLVSYWVLNNLLNRKGLFIVNTFRQKRWYHDIARRKITAVDVLINILLYLVIFLAALLGS